MSANEQAELTPQVYAANTNVGCVREHNEDSFVAVPPLFVVADGMGGHEAGEVASEIAVNSMVAHAPSAPDGDALAEAVRQANLAIIDAVERGVGKPGMGTTMTAAQIFGDKLLIAQVGDSRAYLLHNGMLQRITRDHSLVADLVEMGRITEDEARVHPRRSVITRALGSDPATEPDIYILHVEEGDRLLLCSDGLSSMIEDSAIACILADAPTPADACDMLIREALAAGGSDNVTTVVVDPLKKAPDQEYRKKSKRRKSLAPIIWIVAIVCIIAAFAVGFTAIKNSSYFLHANDEGYVCLYQGFPGKLLGMTFNEEVLASDVKVTELPTYQADLEAGGISVNSREEGVETLESYSVIAQRNATPKKNESSPSGLAEQGN